MSPRKYMHLFFAFKIRPFVLHQLANKLEVCLTTQTSSSNVFAETAIEVSSANSGTAYV